MGLDKEFARPFFSLRWNGPKPKAESQQLPTYITCSILRSGTGISLCARAFPPPL